MAKANYVKAAKDYPAIGVKKGEMYYWWQFFRCPKQMSKTAPRPSQLDNTKLSAALAASEDAETAIEDAATLEEIKEALETASEAIQTVADEYQESFDNLGEGLQQAESGQEMENKVSSLGDWAETLTSDASEIEDFELAEYWKEENHSGKVASGDIEWSDLTEDEQETALQAAKERANENIGYPS